MKRVIRLLFIAAIIAAFCLIEQTGLLCAQQGAGKQTGSLVGVVRDPVGAVVRGAKVEVKNLASGAASTRETNGEGRFSFQDLEAGRYDATVAVSGFQIAATRGIAVAAGKETVADMTLHIAPLWTRGRSAHGNRGRAGTQPQCSRDRDRNGGREPARERSPGRRTFPARTGR